MSSLPKARYFPVLPRPLKMAAGLNRFGTDFGQGERDQQFFQLDQERSHYLAAKRRAPTERRVLGVMDEANRSALEAALGWMRTTLGHEAPEVLAECAQDREAHDELDALARALQEDLCVLGQGEDLRGRAALIDVRFPSGWRPERLRDADFQTIHEPVPGFPGSAPAARSMVQAMVERGPFVRFVWTLSASDRLDQHPDAPRVDWHEAEGVWLRVERQISVPLTAAAASLFLIRVYQYAFSELLLEQQACVRDAVALMPEDIRQYKNLPPPAALAALTATAAAREHARV